MRSSGIDGSDAAELHFKPGSSVAHIANGEPVMRRLRSRHSLGEGPEREASRQPADDKDRLAVATVEAMPVRKGRLDREVLVVEALSGYRGAKKGVPDAETGELKGGVARYEEIRTRYGPHATDHMEGARKAMGRAEGPEGCLSHGQTLVRTSK